MEPSASNTARPLRILLGCTGSVACVNVPLLVERLKATIKDCEIRVVFTTNSLHFFPNLDEYLSPGVKVFRDGDEWSTWSKMGDPVLHIELRKWADLLLVAPLNANTLAKFATGICDNLLTCVARTWDATPETPVIICPAMNTSMWNHPITSQQINVLKCWQYIEIPPIAKKLACGDEGIGGMAEVDSIISRVNEVAGRIPK